MNTTQTQHTPTKDLALAIVQTLNPGGYAHYCYGTQEENDRAKLRDWMRAAAQIRPLIEAHNASLVEQVAKLRGALKRMVAYQEGFTQHCASKPDAITEARAVLAETEETKP